MSLINQMLADLERRSPEVRPSALDPEIRTVSRPRRPWLGVGVMLAAGVIGGAAMTGDWARQAPGPAEVGAARPPYEEKVTASGLAEAPEPAGGISHPVPALDAGAGRPGGEAQKAEPQPAAAPDDVPGALEQTASPPSGEAGTGLSAPTSGHPNMAPRPEARRRVAAAAPSTAPVVSGGKTEAPPGSVPTAGTTRQAGGDATPGSESSLPAPTSEKTGGEPFPQAPLSIDKKIRPPTHEEQAENEFRRGLAALQRHRDGEAMDAFRAALERNPRHETARQSLVALLLERNQLAGAESVLEDGLALNPRQTGFAAALARIQVERGEATAALRTLEAAAPHAEASAEFEAFFAALLHRAGRHREAVERYARALRLAPGTGVWLLGMGLALQADGRPAEARAAFEQARGSRQLSAELTAFVEQRLGQLPAN